jgi:hypothetical protein
MSEAALLPAKPPAKPGENHLQNRKQNWVKTWVKPGECWTPHTPHRLSPSSKVGLRLLESPLGLESGMFCASRGPVNLGGQVDDPRPAWLSTPGMLCNSSIAPSPSKSRVHRGMPVLLWPLEPSMQSQPSARSPAGGTPNAIHLPPALQARCRGAGRIARFWPWPSLAAVTPRSEAPITNLTTNRIGACHEYC